MTLEREFREHERLLWGLGYRMTGSAADADDIVQETFARALAHPPKDTASPLKPWLVKVAVNLGHDRLRARKEKPYEGQWLPAPVPVPVIPEEEMPDARYGMLESVTFAFLLALEALTPKQRAVLVLTDVFDYSAKDVAHALAISEGDVRTTHHRARAAMETYETRRVRPTQEVHEKTRLALESLMIALGSGDVKAMEALLAADVRLVTDGGNGEFHAANAIVRGPSNAARVLLGITTKVKAERSARFVDANGLPALMIDQKDAPPKVAPRLLFRVDVDATGKIVSIESVLASAKLTRF